MMASLQQPGNAPDLASMLREGTAAAHRHTEGARFFKALLTNQVGRDIYAQLLLRLHPVYRTIEECMEVHRDHPSLAPLYRPELHRSAALSADLRFFLGNTIHGEAPSRAAARYVSRIRKVSDDEPLLLIAHAYTRYLGDLSGGQVVARRLRVAFGLDSDNGLAFYQFPAIPDADAYKREYRRILSGLAFDDGEKARIVEEANLAFHLNREVAEELWQDYLADA